MSNQKIPDMRTMTGIRQRHIRVFTWLLGIFNPDTLVIHDNRQNNLFGLSCQADRSNPDILAVSGERPKGPYDREFVHNNTITMNGDWLRDESNYDTIKINCDWIMGPSNREMHAMNGNHETVTVVSANMTCWARHAETVLAMKADALVLQETRLTRLTQVRATKKAAFQGYDVVWGQGMRQMKTRLRGKTRLFANRLCTAVSVSSRTRKPYLAFLQLVPRMAQQRLWPRADGICVQQYPYSEKAKKQFLHITTLYLEPQFDTPAQARKERTMKLALEDIAKLGDQAALICADQNCSSMAVIEAAIEAEDWVDLGKRFAFGDPEPTYGRDKAWDRVAAEHRTSRPDRVYANAIEAKAITKYRLIRHTGIPQHLSIEITFRAAALKKKYIAIQPPAAFPVDEHQRSEEEQESADQRIASQYKHSLEASRVQGDAQTAWQIFHKAAEDYLEWLCKDVAADKGPAGERGRGRLPKLVEREVAATARCSAYLQPETATIRLIAKALRGIREMKTKIARDEETIMTQAEKFFSGAPCQKMTS